MMMTNLPIHLPMRSGRRGRGPGGAPELIEENISADLSTSLHQRL
jgi:hypothetical protein